MEIEKKLVTEELNWSVSKRMAVAAAIGISALLSVGCASSTPSNREKDNSNVTGKDVDSLKSDSAQWIGGDIADAVYSLDLDSLERKNTITPLRPTNDVVELLGEDDLNQEK